MPEYISALRNNYHEKMTITNRFLYWLFPIPDSVYLSQQNVRRDILGKHAKHPIAIQTIYMYIWMRWNALVKNNIGSIKCYQVWKIVCNNAIYCQRLIIEQKSLFWLVLQYVIEISSILSFLNEATTIKTFIKILWYVLLLY